MAPRDVAPFIPSISAAKKHHLVLPSVKPLEENRFAALVLDLELHMRERWSEVESAPADTVRVEHPPPTWKRGQMAHVAGKILQTRGGWSQYRLDHYFDKRVRYENVVTPKEVTSRAGMAGLDEALDALFVGRVLPEALRCHDLTPRSKGGAYRAAISKRDPDFHGHSFGKALNAAKRTVNGLLRRGQAMGGRIDVYAVPLLWLHYDEDQELRNYVLFYDAAQKLHAFCGTPPDD